MKRAASNRRRALALLLWAIVVALWVRHMLPGEKAETEPMYLGAAASTVNEMPLPAQTPAVTPEPPPTPRQPESDAVYLAQCLWGEARGIPSQTEKAAVVWCVLNRVDHPGFPDTIHGVLSAPNQFLGFSERFPVDPELLALAQDVLDRWRAENAWAGCCRKTICGSPPTAMATTLSGRRSGRARHGSGRRRARTPLEYERRSHNAQPLWRQISR